LSRWLEAAVESRTEVGACEDLNRYLQSRLSSHNTRRQSHVWLIAFILANVPLLWEKVIDLIDDLIKAD
jgi:hypothetical protein